MSYSPTLGRFLERDPVGDLAMQTMMFDGGSPSGSTEAPVTLQAIASAFDKTAAKVGPAAAAGNLQLLQYAGGANTYQFMLSNPITGVDPSGLDRHIDSDGYLHYFIVVDNWTLGKNSKGCTCWKKNGQTRYDFRMAYTDLWLEMQITNAIGAITFSSMGEVAATPYSGTPMYTIPSTPEADQALQTQLDMMVANPPNYHALFYNCNWWAEKWKNYGIKETAGKKGLPICP